MMIIIVKTNYLVVAAVAVAALQFFYVCTHILFQKSSKLSVLGNMFFLPPVHMEYKTVIFLPYATPAERSS